MGQQALSTGLEYDRMFRDLRSRQRKAALTAAIGGMTGTISPEQAMAKYGLRRASPTKPPTEARLAMQQQLIDHAKNLADLRKAGDESTLEAIKQSVELKKQMLQSASQLSGATVSATAAVASARNAALAALNGNETDITKAAMKYVTDSGIDARLAGFNPTDPDAAVKMKAILGSMTEQLQRAAKSGQAVAFSSDVKQFLQAVNNLSPTDRAKVLASANLFIMAANDPERGAPQSLPDLLRDLENRNLLGREEARFTEHALSAEKDMVDLVDKVVMESQVGAEEIKKQLAGGVSNKKAIDTLDAAIDAMRGKFPEGEDPLAQLTRAVEAGDDGGIDEVLPKILEGLEKLSEENLDPSLREVREAMKASDWFKDYMAERQYTDPDMAFKAYYREVKDEVKARRAATRQNERAFRSGQPPAVPAAPPPAASQPAASQPAAPTPEAVPTGGAPLLSEAYEKSPPLKKPPSLRDALRGDLS